MDAQHAEREIFICFSWKQCLLLRGIAPYTIRAELLSTRSLPFIWGLSIKPSLQKHDNTKSLVITRLSSQEIPDVVLYAQTLGLW